MKFRDVERTGEAALVIDDVVPPWRPRGIEVRGRAEARGDPAAVIRIHPGRIISWGLADDDGRAEPREARNVGKDADDPAHILPS